jgi:hypothetical protein
VGGIRGIIAVGHRPPVPGRFPETDGKPAILPGRTPVRMRIRGSSRIRRRSLLARVSYHFRRIGAGPRSWTGAFPFLDAARPGQGAGQDVGQPPSAAPGVPRAAEGGGPTHPEGPPATPGMHRSWTGSQYWAPPKPSRLPGSNRKAPSGAIPTGCGHARPDGPRAGCPPVGPGPGPRTDGSPHRRAYAPDPASATVSPSLSVQVRIGLRSRFRPQRLRSPGPPWARTGRVSTMV